jgi:hypothetical protein
MSSVHFDAALDAIALLTEPEKLELLGRIARSLQAEPGPSLADRKAALLRLCAELDELPVGNPADGWSNREHDAAIYGTGP